MSSNNKIRLEATFRERLMEMGILETCQTLIRLESTNTSTVAIQTT